MILKTDYFQDRERERERVPFDPSDATEKGRNITGWSPSKTFPE